MTKQLITIDPNTKAVSARELHAFLEIQSRFNDWIKNRIEKYDFIENQDFILVTKILVTNNPKNPTAEGIDYDLTLDTAKELAMVEGNERGKQARRYFIECEKALRQPKQMSIKEMALLVIAQEEEKERLQLAVAELAPKAEYTDEVLQSETTYDVNEIAKELGTSAITLNKRLNDLKIQYKSANGVWLLYAAYQCKGYTRTVTELRQYGKKKESIMRTVWTESGRKFLHTVFNNKLTESELHYQRIG
jgi:anti-repressor protein